MVEVKKSTRSIKGSEISRSWHLIDVAGKNLGRTIPEITMLLQGKGKVTYSPNLDAGDYVVVVNVMKVKLSGKKESQKKYTYFSGYPGGLRSVTFKEMLVKNPKEIIRHAVAGMLPKNKARDPRLARLFIYEGAEHPYIDKLKEL